VAFAADRADAEMALTPFNECPLIERALFVQDCAESSLAEQRAQQARQNPEHAQYITDNAWIDGENTTVGVAAMVEGIRPLFTENPTDKGFAIWMSNAPMRRDLPDMAFSLQTEAYVAAYTVYDDPEDYARNRSWIDRAFAHAQPVTAGQYLGDSDMTNRQLRFMAPENWERLQTIIARRDPHARFHRYLAKNEDRLNINHWEYEEVTA
jgi:FAD/FMN-containing dehydrogenase